MLGINRNTDKNKVAFTHRVRDSIKFLEYAPVVFLSARTRSGVNRLFPMIRDAYRAACHRVSTAELNRFFATLEFDPDRTVKVIECAPAAA